MLNTYFILLVRVSSLVLTGSGQLSPDGLPRVHVDSHVVATVDLVTSLVAGVVVFSMLGHTAHQFNIPISAVAKGGQGLAFVAYPEVGYAPYFNRTFAYEIYYNGIYFLDIYF